MKWTENHPKRTLSEQYSTRKANAWHKTDLGVLLGMDMQIFCSVLFGSFKSGHVTCQDCCRSEVCINKLEMLYSFQC